MAQSQQYDIARKTSVELASEFGLNLPDEVDKELKLIVQNPESTEESLEKMALGVSIASLIIQVASFCVQIHDSHRQDVQSLQPHEELYLATYQEVQDKISETLSSEQTESLDRIIHVTVSQTLSYYDKKIS
jgi:hypothetical protein